MRVYYLYHYWFVKEPSHRKSHLSSLDRYIVVGKLTSTLHSGSFQFQIISNQLINACISHCKTYFRVCWNWTLGHRAQGQWLLHCHSCFLINETSLMMCWMLFNHSCYFSEMHAFTSFVYHSPSVIAGVTHP